MADVQCLDIYSGTLLVTFETCFKVFKTEYLEYLPHVEIKRRLSMHLKNLHRMWWRKFTDKIEIPSLFKHFPIIIEYINWIDVITRGRGPRRAPSTRCWAGWSWWGIATWISCPPAPPSLAASSSGHESLFVSWHGHPDNEETRRLVILSSINQKYSFHTQHSSDSGPWN